MMTSDAEGSEQTQKQDEAASGSSPEGGDTLAVDIEKVRKCSMKLAVVL